MSLEISSLICEIGYFSHMALEKENNVVVNSMIFELRLTPAMICFNFGKLITCCTSVSPGKMEIVFNIKVML